MVGCYSSAPSRGWSGCTISDGILYVGTIQGKIVSLNAANGTELGWEKEINVQSSSGFGCSNYISKPMSTYGVPVIKDGVVYVGGYDGNVYAFAAEGGMSAEFETGGDIVGSPVTDDETNTLFVGSSDGKLYALAADNIENKKWEFQTGDRIWSTPAVDNGVVYIGSTNHRLYAIDIETHEEIWHFEAEAAILSTPLVYEDTIYIGACDNKFYAIDAASGEEIWHFEAGNWFWTQALAYNGEIWVGSVDHNVYILNAVSGEKTGEVKTDGRVCTPPVKVKVNDTKYLIVIGSEDGWIYTIDPENKSSTQLRDLEAPILAPIYADTEDGIIYVHAQDGSHILYAIKVSTASTSTEIWHYTTSG